MRFAESKPAKAITKNRAISTSFTSTKTALMRADSFAPDDTTSAMVSTSKAAGRLMIPPSDGAFDNDAGMVMSNACDKPSLRYSLQPTETAAIPTPYSRIKHQPTTHATNSPTLA